MTEWHLYQHDTNEDVRYWVEALNGEINDYVREDTNKESYQMYVNIRSPRNIVLEPDVYAWPAERSVPSGPMPAYRFLKFYTRVSNG